ncbi:MAG: ATP-binding protein [Candidatus Sericytochromatia bacterium]|nr:ATP-binding protein [Candidatus Sericytochromatia bacterium]
MKPMAAAGCEHRVGHVDTTYYLNLFLDEVHGKLSLVGERLAALEQHPTDADAIDEVFREIHSFKGNASTVGLDELAEVAHEMETTLAALRAGELPPDPALFRLLNRVLAAMEVRLALPAGPEPAGAFPAALLAELRGITLDLSAPLGLPAAPEAASPGPAPGAAGRPPGGRRVRVAVTLADACLIPSTRAFMVATTLELAHTVVEVSPAPDALEAMEAGATFSVELLTDADDDALRAEVAELGDVAAVTVEAVEALPPPPIFALPAPAHDRLLAAGPGRIWVSRVRFDAACAMPEARAALVTQALQACGEVLQTQLVAGAAWLLLRTEQEEPVLRAAVAGIAEVREVSWQAAASPAEWVTRVSEPAAPPPARPAARTVRVPQAQLGALEALAARLLATHRALAAALDGADTFGLAAEAATLATALQADLRALSRTPAELLLARYPRMVRDLAQALGKEVELHLTGQEVLLDAPLAEGLGDVLVHLLRNAVDHGLEGPEERRQAGKPAVGALRLTVRQEPDALHVTLADDGRGLDPEALRRAAVARGRLTPKAAAALATSELVGLVFEPGFSTREHVTRISGRGIGLDAVRHKVEALGGTLTLENHPGRGLVFRLRFRLSPDTPR